MTQTLNLTSVRILYGNRACSKLSDSRGENAKVKNTGKIDGAGKSFKSFQFPPVLFSCSRWSRLSRSMEQASIGKSRSPTNFRRLWRFLSSKETKSSLISITYYYILKIINVCQDNVKHGKNCTHEWFYFLRGVITVGEIMLRRFTKKCMESRASKLFAERCIWFNLYAKVAQFFFRVLILRYLVLQDIKYCMVPTWPHKKKTNLYNFRFVLMLAWFSA